MEFQSYHNILSYPHETPDFSKNPNAKISGGKKGRGFCDSKNRDAFDRPLDFFC